MINFNCKDIKNVRLYRTDVTRNLTEYGFVFAGHVWFVTTFDSYLTGLPTIDRFNWQYCITFPLDELTEEDLNVWDCPIGLRHEINKVLTQS